MAVSASLGLPRVAVVAAAALGARLVSASAAVESVAGSSAAAAALPEPIEDVADEEDTFASINSIVFTGSLLALIAIGYIINTRRVKHVSESGVAVVLGFIVGVVVRMLGLNEEAQVLDFRGEFFFHVLLPPIIFEAGMSLETQMFADNLGAICAFAVVGTLISTWVVSAGLRRAATSGLIGLADTPRLGVNCHLFGALISATDPVATIALFGSQRFRTDPLLHALVNGESVLNDAVAIVLFSTLSHHAEESVFSVAILWHFCLVSLGSLVMGLAAGALCSWCFCQTMLRRFPDYEISAMCLGAYLTFALSQLMGLSGIVALFFFGVVLAHYNWHNLSEPSKVASKVTFGTLAKLAESCVFLYLGIVAALSLGRFHWHLSLVVYATLLILVARAAHVFPLSVFLNLGRTRGKISKNMSIMIWASGLRGAIAFALALRIPCASGRFDRRGSDECRNSDLLVTTTISIVLLTTVVMGTSMERMATALEVVRPVEPIGGGSLDMLLSTPNHSGCSQELSEPLAVQERHASADDGGGPVDASSSSSRLGDSGRGAASSSHGGSGGTTWSSRLAGRGYLYQAFARLDRGVLQPVLGGPSSRAVAGSSGAAGARGGGGGEGETMELSRLQGFAEQPGWSRHQVPPPPTDDEAPAWSRSFVFE
eukprot:TRINITY_DN3386_c0_g1_i3.p1 TRINITY_DN3386_c0_g1~~TRINITY_DN3386_c0_g1_i3.p1  ORF type:complete len:683 (-),score=127.96 TRINITY_DN3386_c0_g1_i3:242-2209(-)